MSTIAQIFLNVNKLNHAPPPAAARGMFDPDLFTLGANPGVLVRRPELPATLEAVSLDALRPQLLGDRLRRLVPGPVP